MSRGLEKFTWHTWLESSKKWKEKIVVGNYIINNKLDEKKKSIPPESITNLMKDLVQSVWNGI